MECRELGKLCNERDVKSTSLHYADNAILYLFRRKIRYFIYAYVSDYIFHFWRSNIIR